jgi:hypothetical protein
MSRDRRTLLQLIALGQVTPAEAERILLLWNDERETLWVIAACIALAAVGGNPGHAWISSSAHTAHSLFPAAMNALHHAVSLIDTWFGGTQ